MKRTKKSPASNPAAGAVDNGGTMTVVDGNAVGVAPSGETSDAEIEALLAEADGSAAETTTEPVAADDDLDAEILAMLSDESAETPVATVADPDVTEGAEEIVAETTDDVDVEIEAHDEDAILAELEGDTTTPATSTDADPAATTTPKKKREPKTPAAPTRAFTDVAAIDPNAFKTNLDGSSAKKVNEKVANLIQSVERGSKLSRYTQVAVKKLVSDGKVSGKTLVEAFEAEGLKIGTARAQSQQMTALFKIVGLVTPDTSNPRELVLADKALADELVLLAA